MRWEQRGYSSYISNNSFTSLIDILILIIIIIIIIIIITLLNVCSFSQQFMSHVYIYCS